MSNDDNYSIFPLLAIVLVIMLGFAAFFISFLLAPLAVLGIFYLFLFMRERSRSRREGVTPDPDLEARLAREREAREREMEREREGIPVEELLANARGERAREAESGNGGTRSREAPLR